jgi:hypothetical protein
MMVVVARPVIFWMRAMLSPGSGGLAHSVIAAARLCAEQPVPGGAAWLW